MAVETTSLAGKRVLVTGGTTGIGRATVALLAEQGARVVTFGRHQPELEDALAHARAVNPQADVFGLTADVSTREGVARVFAAVDDSLGGLDILINNAGLAVGGAQDETDEDWRLAAETNFLGYIACAREAIARLKDSGGGHLVFVGSISAEFKGAGSSVYAATKAGIETYAKTLRKEVMDLKIKVTLVEPGSVGADMQEKSPAEQREAIARNEMLYAEELADTIGFALTRSVRTDVSVLRVEPLVERA
ncbi:SDR family oxidoreductase [Asticcacaulis excentricus]|uniref:Short-chain dehydrogenase/reductase SDR n=1 Tax=Asticcacaulis excentricus (strain ATCC 15261 / DSM 4724 / KCTC 12464 / NCIMB 9791 / VKM B-1370 / CB 48) TaxID=573065 RepID=E8RVG5_ASTEC|nr:SDR family oxidoreductase [Asticcacaulis excentricus]ADU15306.1 short-chain dehydrogenase/reductase SDR [Asticcacaulis excentricus CB 48]